MSANTYHVRLKPYNKRKGYLVRNYIHRGVRFTERWSVVSAAIAHELVDLVQPHASDDEIPLFDVKTEQEAVAIESKERDDGLGIKRVAAAAPITDKSFRHDGPKFNKKTGEIEDDNEPAEVINAPKAPVEKDDLAEASKAEVQPAPSLRARTRTSND